MATCSVSDPDPQKIESWIRIRIRIADPNGRSLICTQIYVFSQIFWKWYFSPSHDTSFYDSHRGLFALILPYFAIILSFYLPFSNFHSPFFLFLFPFFLFLLHFPFFPPFAFSYFFPQVTSADISPPQGGRYFLIYRPLDGSIKDY